MTKAEVAFLMGAGYSLAEIIELDQEPKSAPAQPEQPAPAAAQPAQDAQGTPEAEQTQKDPAAEAKPAQDATAAALTAEVKLLRQTVKDLQAAALAAASQPGKDPESIEDIIAKL